MFKGNSERNQLLETVQADFVNHSKADLAKVLDVHLDNLALTMGEERLVEYLKAKYSLENIEAPAPLFGKRAA